MFHEVLMEKKANRVNRASAHLANAIMTNPYAITGALGGGIGGAVVAGEGNRTKGALGGAVLGGLAGKGIQEGVARFGPRNRVYSPTGEAHNPESFIRSIRDLKAEEIADGLYDSAFESPLVGKTMLKQFVQDRPVGTAAVLGTGLATGAGTGALIRKRKEKKNSKSAGIARPKRSQEKKAGIELSIPELHDRTKADDLRSVFGKRLKHMSDEEVVREYASRTENKGRLYGGLLGGAVGSGALGATLGGGLLGSGDVDTSSITKGDLRKRVLGGAIGAGVGAYLGGRYGRDHAYHVSDAAIPILRKQLEKED